MNTPQNKIKLPKSNQFYLTKSLLGNVAVSLAPATLIESIQINKKYEMYIFCL